MTTAPMRPAPTPEQRAEVEELVCDLPGGRPGELSFDEPWEIRAFALAVAGHKAGQFPWASFQSALIESIRKWESSVDDLSDTSWSYYEHWVEALEQVLTSSGSIEGEALDNETDKVLATPPNRNHHKAHLDPVAIDPPVATGR
ncbi:MAG TPA: nitrile hydratase accessory protein [Amycolatopsis sp.]|nr:nitrile hydratase accessory protein [Amycolatopsis sp.]